MTVRACAVLAEEADQHSWILGATSTDDDTPPPTGDGDDDEPDPPVTLAEHTERMRRNPGHGSQHYRGPDC